MTPLPTPAAALLLTLVVPLTGTTTLAAGATPIPPHAAPDVWLKGAFGRVSGSDPLRPAAAAPNDQPLDVWMRQAPLELQVDTAFEDLLGVTVISRPLEGDAAEESLSAGATLFEGPDVPGPAIIVATVSTESAGATEHAWLVEVPDREPSTDALFEIPGPQLLLVSEDATVAGAPGHGCYAYLCVDIGEPSPARSLDILPAAVGETLALVLSDGSAMAGWTGTLTRLGESGAGRLAAAEAFPDAPQAEPSLTGLETTSPGEWLLELRADYDRERGWQWFRFRVLAK